jgi:nucleoid-associated protein YgaU
MHGNAKHGRFLLGVVLLLAVNGALFLLRGALAPAQQAPADDARAATAAPALPTQPPSSVPPNAKASATPLLPPPTAAPPTLAPPTAPPLGAPSATPTGPTAHIVRPGQTLEGIAVRYGVTVAAIVAANDIDDPDLIVAGTELIIPPPEAEAP